jgi:hypothetical protein
MKITYLSFWFLMISFSLFAQKKMDLLILKNGTKRKGRVESYKKDDHLNITFENGISVIYSKDFMPLIDKVFIGGRPDYTHKNGFYGQAKVGLIFSDEDFSNTIITTGTAVNGIVGFQHSRWLRLEMGLGRESYNELNVIPIFIGTQANWFRGNFTPYHFANIGYGIAYQRKFRDGDQQLYDNVKGGTRLEAGFGIKKFGAKSAFLMSIAYLKQLARIEYEAQSRNFTTMDMRQVSFSIGFEF